MKNKSTKISKQQIKFMESAGFIINHEYSKGSELIYWKRGDIYIALFRNRRISIREFTDCLIDQSVYRAKEAFYKKIVHAMSYDKEVKNLFKVTND